LKTGCFETGCFENRLLTPRIPETPVGTSAHRKLPEQAEVMF
jgi:hypothetical protein